MLAQKHNYIIITNNITQNDCSRRYDHDTMPDSKARFWWSMYLNMNIGVLIWLEIVQSSGISLMFAKCLVD